MYAPEMLEQDDEPAAPPRIGYAALQGLKVDANGQVSYDFDGHIHARGLDLDADSGAAFDNEIIWRRVSDGVLVAEIVGGFQGGASALDMAARDGATSAGLAMQADDAGTTDIVVSTDINSALIWNRLAQSRFLQLLTNGQVAIDFGQANVSTAAAIAGNTTVAHSLGRTPVVVLAMAMNSGDGLTVVAARTVTSTSFILGIRYADAVARTLTNPVGWAAIG